ncbi:protein GPR108 isoform X2 [Electrophorus electricus]|uniref:protein GPR108 isoform X2 n=1 Tax=Electrophorus electricus TaxID=8005 RepID=UPI0015D0309A|nr:protein GPR108 isoform X2 [Electrophorus electricus]
MILHRVFNLTLLVFAVLVSLSNARIHGLVLKNETRFVVHLNTFGYFANGTLEVRLKSLYLPQEKKSDYANYAVGFSLSRARVNGVFSYPAENMDRCTLSKTKSDDNLILFIIDTRNLSVHVTSFGKLDAILKSDLKKEEKLRKRREDTDPKPGSDQSPSKSVGGDKVNKKPEEVDEKSKMPVASQVNSLNGMTLALNKKEDYSYNFTFHITMGDLSQGLYSLAFHNCYNMRPGILSPYSISVEIEEKNPAGFLSAAEIPLPRLYICMAAMFLSAAIIWTCALLKDRYSVFKIHWLMAALAYTKALSLVFHSINYHFINTEGHPIEGWAVMYYITHLLKGALLFITLALIGTGFAFVKYILSDKEKKIFMIVIPLQVLANVAYIIIEETEEGASEYTLWREVLFLVDLLCCGAILFPVVWSIRHLQEASNTDGKAAMNLAKLKLFRHYYVMIVCYIYFTRIIAILLKMTVPFQWQWCQEFLIEVSTLVFFVLTGFKFRPASNNPYLQLPQDEEDVEMDEVVTESGALEGISKVKKTSNGRERQREPAL